MTAVGSDDGREIVLELEDLRRQGRVTRDPAEGRYSLIEEPKRDEEHDPRVS